MLVPGDRDLGIDGRAEFSKVEMPAGLREVQVDVKEVSGLCALDQCSQFLRDELDFGQRWQCERRDPELGHVEDGVPKREDGVLANADLELGAARIGQRVEPKPDDCAARRAGNLSVNSKVEFAAGPSKVRD